MKRPPSEISTTTAADHLGEGPSPTTTRHNLPQQTTPFIGRTTEVALVAARLQRPEVRLLTLIGPGGTGKTRLALQLAAELLQAYPDGVWFVALAAVREPSLVLTTIVETVGAPEHPDSTQMESLVAHLRDKRLLLVLDNFEHLVEAAPAVAELLSAAPLLRVLATSREVLRLYGEQVVAVPPLSTPSPDYIPNLEQLAQYDAVRLFSQRAQAARADFELSADNARAIVQICHRLDGLPLAIELAAVRTRLLPLGGLFERLEQRLPLLTGGSRDTPARHQTMRNTIDWSYQLLSDAEQILFRRLGIFAGGFSVDAAETVYHETVDAFAGDPVPVLDLLQSLVDKSLVRAVERATQGVPSTQVMSSVPRFEMLETIREYALDQLAAHNEVESVAQQHANFFLVMAEMTAPKLKGQQQAAWMRRLLDDHQNMRAVFRWASERREVEFTLRLGVALRRFWRIRGSLREDRLPLEVALEGDAAVPPSLKAQALHAAGWLAARNFQRSETLLERSLALARELNDRGLIGAVLHDLGTVLRTQGKHAQAAARFEESSNVAHEIDDSHLLAYARGGLGIIAQATGDGERAIGLLGESLTLSQERRDQAGIAWWTLFLGREYSTRRTYGHARTLLLQSLALFRELTHWDGLALTLESIAGLAAAQGSAAMAGRLLGAAETLRESLGISRVPFDQQTFDRDVAVVRRALGASFPEIWSLGQAMQVEEALATAEQIETVELLDLTSSFETAHPQPATPFSLSEREVEVLRLVAQGMTNQQVAERLIISPHTVNMHLRSIFGKLEVNSRAAAIRLAVERNLLS